MKTQIMAIMLMAVFLSGAAHAGIIEDVQGFFGSLNAAPRLLSIGFTTLSISPSDFRSTDNILNGPVWVLTVRQGGLAQRAEGSISSSLIDVNGKHAQKGFSLDIASTEQSCEYPITVDYNSFPIYNYGYRKYFKFAVDLTDCRKYGEVVAYGDIPLSFDSACVYRSPVSSYVGNLKESGNTIFKSDIELTVDGESPVRATISNKATTFVKIPDATPIAYAQWNGNLQTGETCPSPSQQTVKAVYAQGSWKLVSSTRYQDYVTYTQNIFIDPKSLSLTQIQSIVSNINTKANSAIVQQSFTSDGGNTAQIQNQASVASGIVKLNLDNALQFPVFTFYIKADKLGIYQPIADVAITKVEGATFKTGETGTIYTEIKNIGNVRGGFSVWATCSSPFMMTGATKEFTIEAGDFISTNLPIVASAASRSTGSCTVHAKTFTKEVTQTVTMTVDPQSVCASGSVRCLDDVIKTCNAAGSGYDESKTLDCKSKNQICGTVDNKLACVSKDSSGPKDVCDATDIATKINPLNWFSILQCKIQQALGAIVLILATAISIFFLIPLLKLPQLPTMMTLGLGIAGAVVVYLFAGWLGCFLVIGATIGLAYINWKKG